MTNINLDTDVIACLQRYTGGTAYYISNCINQPRVEVSKSLQRLKRRSIVKCEGSYWTLAR